MNQKFPPVPFLSSPLQLRNTHLTVSLNVYMNIFWIIEFSIDRSYIAIANENIKVQRRKLTSIQVTWQPMCQKPKQQNYPGMESESSLINTFNLLKVRIAWPIKQIISTGKKHTGSVIKNISVICILFFPGTREKVTLWFPWFTKDGLGGHDQYLGWRTGFSKVKGAGV